MAGRGTAVKGLRTRLLGGTLLGGTLLGGNLVGGNLLGGTLVGGNLLAGLGLGLGLVLPGVAMAQQKPAPAPPTGPAMATPSSGGITSVGSTSGGTLSGGILRPPGRRGAPSTPGQPTTLQGALALSYATNPTLLAERAHLRSIDENVPTALAGWRPQVVIGAAPGYSVGRYYEVEQGQNLNFQNNRDVLTAQATITQYLYRGGKTRAQSAQAVNQVMAERGRLIAAEESVFGNVVNSYVTVIEDQQLLQLNINNEQVLRRQLDATNDRFRVGEITRTDVAQAEAALAGATAQREVAEGNLQIARSQYRLYVGVLPDNLIEPQPLAVPVKTAQEANVQASSNNPNVVAALFDDASAKDAVDVALSALMPTVSLQAGVSQSANSTIEHTSATNGLVTANINVPIYQGGAEYAGVRQARQTEQNARKTLDGARRTAVQSATQAYETLVASRATIVSTRAQIRSNEIALEGVEREALVGSRTTLDVLNAEQTLLASQVTLVQNLAALVNASYSLAQAIGRLTAHDLNLGVAYYDETAYYQAVKDRWAGIGDYATDQPGR